MALSGSFSNAYRGWTYRISWSATQSIANNQSIITCDHYIVLASDYSIDIGSRTNSCSVGGSSKSFTSPACSGKGITVKLGTTTHTVTHSASGTASVTITGVFNIQATLAGAYQSSITTSGTATLDTIPRKSTLTVGNGTLGTSKTLTVSRASTAFTHTITWVCGTKSGTICTKSSTTTLYFNSTNGNTIANLAGQAPDSGSVGVVFTITTYDANGNQIGSMQPPKAYFTIPDSIAPTVSITLSDATGLMSTYGGYVQGRSKVSVSASATLAYGSAIAQYTTTIDGSTYNGASITTDYLKSSGALSVKTTAKDGRGHTGTITKNITVIPYAVPKITEVSAYRSTSVGVVDSSGAYITVKFLGTIAPVSNNNGAAYKVQYRAVGTATYTEAVLSSYNGIYDASVVYTFPVGSTRYEIILSATDDFTTTNVAISGAALKKTLSFKWSETGNKFNGIGLLKIAEHNNGVDIGGELYDKFGMLIGNGLAKYTGSGTSAIDPNTTTEHCIVTDRNVPTSGFWYIVTLFYDGKETDGVRSQFAIPYNAAGMMYNRYKSGSTWSAWLCDHPVGSYYIANNSTSPASIFGGTWTRVTGRFLWGCTTTETIGGTGGEKTHILTTTEIPSHTHYLPNTNADGSTQNYSLTYNPSAKGFSGTLKTTAVGGGAAHNNMPPYINVAIWRRTA